MVTWLVTTYQAGHAGFDQLAAYAGIAAVIYGMLAVAVDLGGQAVFYTIAAIIKFIDEWKAEKDAKAVERVSSNPELLEQANRNAQNAGNTNREAADAKRRNRR